jgi:hypothetical protein
MAIAHDQLPARLQAEYQHKKRTLAGNICAVANARPCPAVDQFCLVSIFIAQNSKAIILMTGNAANSRLVQRQSRFSF